MSEVVHFKDYILASTASLNESLLGFVNEEGSEYNVIYEQFLKTIENYKINMINELKVCMCPKYIIEDKKKERDLLMQMKCVVTLKIKWYLSQIFSHENSSIERLNQETVQAAKQELIQYISILNDSLQKIEYSLQYVDHQRGYSPLSQSIMSNEMQFSRLDETLNGSVVQPTKNVTPFVQKKEKGNTDITSKLTPLHSEYAEKTKCGNFKTPVQFNNGIPKTQFKGVSNVTSEPKSEEQMVQVNKLNSFHKTEERNSHQTPNNQHPKPPVSGQTVSLFEMFDKCLSSIMPAHPEGGNAPLTPQMSRNNLLFYTPGLEAATPDNRLADSIKGDDLGASSVGLTIEHLEPTEKKHVNRELGEKLEQKLLGLSKKQYFCRWKRSLQLFYIQQFDDDFDLIHDKIPGMEGLEMPQTHEGFFQEHKDFSLVLNKDDLAKDYISQNLLSTQLSFCEDTNIQTFNSARIDFKPTESSIKIHSTPPKREKPESKKKGKIKEPTIIDEVKPKSNSAQKENREHREIRRPSMQKMTPLSTETARFPQVPSSSTPSGNSASKKAVPKGILEKKNQNIAEKEKPKNQRSQSISKLTTKPNNVKPTLIKPPSNSNKENNSKTTSPSKMSRTVTFTANK